MINKFNLLQRKRGIIMTRRCYKVKEIKEMLGIGKNQTYELIKSKRFPVLKIGKDYLIPMEGFDRWLREGDMGKLAELVQM